ncbi:hypothetical protein DFP72DRAFT_842001 [Ephemerocybe angulata]|uniref:Uncharacterized protein n=1 Tax=Ephemerocybe angulata TaxID=980116 RepID=A0A8H6IAG7_9AGAR|nr:hypothetical protein DFP72DRAFT_842001 [Tulosesus angulatus]
MTRGEDGMRDAGKHVRVRVSKRDASKRDPSKRDPNSRLDISFVGWGAASAAPKARASRRGTRRRKTDLRRFPAALDPDTRLGRAGDEDREDREDLSECMRLSNKRTMRTRARDASVECSRLTRSGANMSKHQKRDRYYFESKDMLRVLSTPFRSSQIRRENAENVTSRHYTSPIALCPTRKVRTNAKSANHEYSLPWRHFSGAKVTHNVI